MSLAGVAFANPEGGTVVGGSATISEAGKKLDIHQHSDRAVIDWRSFNIAIDEHTQFHQPSSSATVLNRINDTNPSQILGRLTANGNVILVNPNGVFFGAGARVDVNSLIATTADIKTSDFMNGLNHFNLSGNPNAAIINEGVITAKEAGLVGLVAPHVINNGIITAKMGRVQLASGDTFTLDFYGDGLLKVAVEDENVRSQLVANAGTISAEGGTIAMTAAAAKNTIDSLILAEGTLNAQTVSSENGTIIIAAAGANKTNKSGTSSVIVNGQLDVSGQDAEEQGGEIEILADEIGLFENTVIDASGYEAISVVRLEDKGTATMRADRSVDNGVRTEDDFWAQASRAGGSIKIGGDYLGRGDTQTATYVYVDSAALIKNDAIQAGDAGRTIIWSDDVTQYYGLTLSRGGVDGGHGGFLETSGKNLLDAQGYADLTARHSDYSKGTYLLDPTDITVIGGITSTDNTSILQHYWDFEEGAGNTVADSAGSADGTGNQSPLTFQADTSSVLTDSNFSLDFASGDDEYVDVGDLSTVELSTTTISFWAKVDNLNKDNGFIYKGDHTTFQPLLIWFDDTVGGIADIGGGNTNAISVITTDSGGDQYWFSTPSNAINNNDWNHISVVIDPGSSFGEIFVNGVAQIGGAALDNNGIADNGNSLLIGKDANLGTDSQDLIGNMDDVRIYDVALSSNQVNELNGNVFSVEKLEQMSLTADVAIIADDTITFDLQGDTLDVSADQSISFTTTNGNITDISAGTIQSTRTTTGGNITINAGDAINLDTTNLEALAGGVVNLQAVNDIDLVQASALNLGNISGDNISIESTGGNLSIASGSTFTGNSFQLETSGNFTNNADINSTGTFLAIADGDVILNADIATTSAAANALVISAVGDFTNTAGSDALSATNSRWLVYSDDPANNTRDNLLPGTVEFNKTYATDAPVTIGGTNNRFIYNRATAPTLTYDVSDVSVEYGEVAGASSVTYNSGLVSDDTLVNINLSGVESITNSYTPGDNVATYVGAVTATTNTLTTNLGYQFSFNSGDVDVTQADLNITLLDTTPSRAAGVANPSFDLSFSGFKLTDTIADIDVQPTAGTTANLSSTAGTYPITISGGSDDNYNFVFSNPAGNLTVTGVGSPGGSVVLPGVNGPLTTSNGSALPNTLEMDIAGKGLSQTRQNSTSTESANSGTKSYVLLSDSQDIQIELIDERTDTTQEAPENETRKSKDIIRLMIEKELAKELQISLN
ncbi:MAG: filamentous hemagglutinin N-terminal domain-containing protein [Pseudomonadota bacterium]